ncbi:MAG: ABC transporter permease [Bacillota bacterium]|nr:ABC transporter permease [Bacillota bacterium]
MKALTGLIKNELIKFTGRKKALWFAALLVVIYLFPVVMSVFVRMRTFDGQIYPYTMSGFITAWVVPLFLIVVTAEMVTDEYLSGGISVSLVHPVSRVQLVTAKITAILIVTVLFLIFAMLLGYAMGTLFFGWGTEFMIRGLEYSVWQGISLTVISFLAPAVPLLSFSMYVFFIALLLSGSAAVVGLAAGTFFAFSLAELVFRELRPYLITAYFSSLPAALISSEKTAGLQFAILFIVVHGAVFYFLSLTNFTRKDILN